MMKRQLQLYSQGFLLPAAIFILVILAALGAYALSISSVQQVTSTQDVQGSRAYQAARAGVEWGIYQVLILDPVTHPDATELHDCPSTTTLTIDSFSVLVTCTQSPAAALANEGYKEQGSDHNIRIYQITSKASAYFGRTDKLNYIERQLQVSVSKCRGTDATPAYQCS